MNKHTIIVYTDGACSGNGKFNAVGGIGVHFPNSELGDISEPMTIEYCTNQKAELHAILTAITYVVKYYDLTEYELLIKTDSEYSINCITQWIGNWLKNGWKTKNGTPVLNREYIEPIYYYYKRYKIEFQHVSAHTNGTDLDSIGNAVADKLAVEGSKNTQSKSAISDRSTLQPRSTIQPRSTTEPTRSTTEPTRSAAAKSTMSSRSIKSVRSTTPTKSTKSNISIKYGDRNLSTDKSSYISDSMKSIDNSIFVSEVANKTRNSRSKFNKYPTSSIDFEVELV